MASPLGTSGRLLAIASARRAWVLRDVVFWWSMAMLAVVGTLVVALIAVFLIGEAMPLLLQGGYLRFVTDPGWWPRDGAFNMLPMIVASVCLAGGAMALAAPFGIAFAVCTSLQDPPIVGVALRAIVEASAAVPTVIYGLWGLTVIVPLVGRIAPPGASLVAGIIVLAIMVFPTITLLVQATLRAVPREFAQAASALGVTRSQTILHVVLPAARRGILSALVLGATRAIGETMVVLMVCGNIVQIPTSVFQPVRALTANIALEMPFAMGDHRASLFVAGLLMLLVVACMVAVAEWVRARDGAAAW